MVIVKSFVKDNLKVRFVNFTILFFFLLIFNHMNYDFIVLMVILKSFVEDSSNVG